MCEGAEMHVPCVYLCKGVIVNFPDLSGATGSNHSAQHRDTRTAAFAIVIVTGLDVTDYFVNIVATHLEPL